MSAYLLALFSLYSSGRERNKLLFMWPFMCLYAALSRSMFALGLLLCGLILFWIISGARSKIGLIFLLGVLISGAAGVYSLRYEAGGSLAKKMEHPMVSGLNSRDEAVRPTASPGSGDIAAARESLSYLFSADMDARSAIWSFYLQGMKKADTKTLLFGHSAVPQRNVYPSAHNYYLDILYNFGFVTLLPVLLLILYTLRLTWDKRMEVLRHPQLLGLGFIVFFLIFVENSFKVGLRQPYSGIYSFFLWGLFISHLRIAGGARTDKSSMKIAVLNLTGGGISGGHRKYLVNILPRLEALVKTGTILCASPASINVKGWLTADTSISFAECETFKPFLHSPSAALRSTLDLFNPELLFIPIERYIKYKGLPVVVMLQNMAPLTGAKTGTGLKEWLVSIMRRYETRYALKRAAAVIVPTAYVRDFLIGQERINARKIFLIPYGNSPLPPAPVKPAGFPFADSKFIFTAGSMEIYRGVEDLVRAFPAVKAGNPGVKLVVAGGTRTETKRYLAGLKETASRLGVGDDVVYLGNIEEAELSWCYSNCSAFALTSRVESFCFVALEAMAHGCSIVSTDSACLPEIFKDVAFYYKPGDEKGLSRALLSILSRTEAERLVISSAAVAQAASFSWDAAAAATLGVLKKAVPAS
ncbi:MAG: glycosyltransferase family 4 protein [Elusimicrobiota bacterium]|nr:glycosyltransferase family 4 protein [Elusimicrobiota bacterium]